MNLVEFCLYIFFIYSVICHIEIKIYFLKRNLSKRAGEVTTDIAPNKITSKETNPSFQNILKNKTEKKAGYEIYHLTEIVIMSNSSVKKSFILIYREKSNFFSSPVFFNYYFILFIFHFYISPV